MNEYRLEQLFDLQMGKTPSRNESSYWLNGFHDWISIRDLSNSSKYISKTNEKLSDIAVKESGIRIIPKDTVIMSFKLSIGKVAITSHDMYSNEAIMAFHDKKIIEILPEYLYYLLLAKNWNEGSNKAVMGITLNKATLSMIKIRMHDIVNQVQIASILDNLDKQINNKKKQLIEYDQLIKSRFVEMFGDPELNEKEFPMLSFRDICSVRQGLQIPISKRLKIQKKNSFKYITVAYINGKKEEEYVLNPKETVICTKDDLLMTRTGNTGMVVTNVEGVFHNNFFLIDFKRDRYNKIFLYHYLNLEFIQAEILRRAGTSTIPDINHSEFYKIRIFDAPIELQNEFASLVQQVDKLKFVVQKSLDETQKLFDSLMQEYFG